MVGKRIWREYLILLLICSAAALLFRATILTAYRVPSSSMLPTLQKGDFILVSRAAYGWHFPFLQDKSNDVLPKRGDVIVFSYSSQPGVNFVKRVVALAGDRVEFKDGRLIINQEVSRYTAEEALSEPGLPGHLTEENSLFKAHILSQLPEGANFGPVVVPPNHVFALGDNRDLSDDSRTWGAIPLENISGKVTWIWISIHLPGGQDSEPQARFIRWDRVFKSVH